MKIKMKKKNQFHNRKALSSEKKKRMLKELGENRSHEPINDNRYQTHIPDSFYMFSDYDVFHMSHQFNSPFSALTSMDEWRIKLVRHMKHIVIAEHIKAVRNMRFIC